MYQESLLELNGNPISYIRVEETVWIPVKPICDALKIDADRSIKNIKKDPILGPQRSEQTVQVGKKGKKQGRKMICLTEKYIYGWLFSLRSDSKELIKYKRECYELLYNHFHGTITNRKSLLSERKVMEKELHVLKQQMLENSERYIKIQSLEKRKREINLELKGIDNDLVTDQGSLF